MEVVLAREQVGCGETHERQARAIGAATNWLLDGREASGADRLARALHYLRMPVEHFAHVPVLLLDLDLDSHAGLSGHGMRELLDDRLLLAQPWRGEVAQQHADGGPIDRGIHLV